MKSLLIFIVFGPRDLLLSDGPPRRNIFKIINWREQKGGSGRDKGASETNGKERKGI